MVLFGVLTARFVAQQVLYTICPDVRLLMPPVNADHRPDSPCVANCTLDDENCCVGCGRTLEQITRWSLMSREEQWAVVNALAAQAVTS